MFIVYGIILLGTMCIGAWLVDNGHPWFALLCIVIGASLEFTRGSESDEKRKKKKEG